VCDDVCMLVYFILESHFWDSFSVSAVFAVLRENVSGTLLGEISVYDIEYRRVSDRYHLRLMFMRFVSSFVDFWVFGENTSFSSKSCIYPYFAFSSILPIWLEISTVFMRNYLNDKCIFTFHLNAFYVGFIGYHRIIGLCLIKHGLVLFIYKTLLNPNYLGLGKWEGCQNLSSCMGEMFLVPPCPLLHGCLPL